ncbi:MAG: Dabb family protein [Actinobacteria bacterium]|nr:Dabb family protein [Actinomycetota bacterium]
MIHHIVLLTLVDRADAPKAINGLRAMRGQIPALRALNCGLNTGDEPNASDIVLITEHDNEAGLAEYTSDPVHQALLSWLVPLIAGTVR